MYSVVMQRVFLDNSNPFYILIYTAATRTLSALPMCTAYVLALVCIADVH